LVGNYRYQYLLIKKCSYVSRGRGVALWLCEKLANASGVKASPVSGVMMNE